MPIWTDERLFTAFAWRGGDPDEISKARRMMSEARPVKKGGKSAVDWEGFRFIDRGFMVCYKAPATVRVAHRWIWGRLGETVEI